MCFWQNCPKWVLKFIFEKKILVCHVHVVYNREHNKYLARDYDFHFHDNKHRQPFLSNPVVHNIEIPKHPHPPGVGGGTTPLRYIVKGSTALDIFIDRFLIESNLFVIKRKQHLAEERISGFCSQMLLPMIGFYPRTG